MKKILVLCLTVLVAACASREVQVAQPASLQDCEMVQEAEQRSVCLLMYVAKLEKEMKSAKAGDIEQRQPAPVVPTGQPVAQLLEVPASQQGAPSVRYVEDRPRCVATQSVSVANDTLHYHEVVNVHFLPCWRDDFTLQSDLVLQFVKMPNGGVRRAWLIPPKGVGNYYVDSDGTEDYRVVSYGADPRLGEYEYAPRKAVAQSNSYRLRLPFDNKWWSVTFYASDFPRRNRFN
jgi:hypothetical protein